MPSEAKVKLWDAWEAVNDDEENKALWVETVRLLEQLTPEEQAQETQAVVTWGLLRGWLSGEDLDAEMAELLRD